MGTTSAG